jgi:hypothetical protein
MLDDWNAVVHSPTIHLGFEGQLGAHHSLLFQTTMILLRAIVRSASDRKPHFGWPPGAVRLPHTVTDLSKGEQSAERGLYLRGRHVTAEVIVDSLRGSSHRYRRCAARAGCCRRADHR